MATVYWDLFKPLLNKPINFLEIGIYEGGSLEMFQQMLPQAMIYGIDILPRPEAMNKEIFTRVLDQGDAAGLEELAKEAGDFDIIIDDGSHFTELTKTSFYALWPHLKKDGIYVIEDWSIALANVGNPNTTYAAATKGMDKLCYEIASQALELGITEIEIIKRKNSQSYAIYKK